MVSDKLDVALAARVLASGDPAEGPQPRVRVLVHVTGDLAAVERAGLWTESFIGGIVIGTVATDSLDIVAELDDVAFVQINGTDRLRLHTSAAEIRADHARSVPPGFTGRKVIVGVVDSGIDIFHHAFRKPDGTTRIKSLLDTTLRQTFVTTGNPAGGDAKFFWRSPRPAAPSGGGAAAPWPPEESTPDLTFPILAPQLQTALEAFTTINPGDISVTGGPFPANPISVDFIGRYDGTIFDTSTIAAIEFTGHLMPSGATTPAMVLRRGREFGPTEINAALQTPARPFVSRDLVGHGTEVAGIAAGDGSQSGNCHGTDYYVGVAPEAELVIVKTTTQVSENIQGVEHVFSAAGSSAAVVNISLGSNVGPHDGTDAEEISFDGLLDGTTKRSIVIAAGNDGELVDPGHPERHPQAGGGIHARKTVAPNGLVELAMEVGANDRAIDRFAIWYSGAGRLSFNLTTPNPGGTTLPAAVAAGAGTVRLTLATHPLVVLSTLNNRPSGKHCIAVLLSPGAGGVVANGRWLITLRETSGTPVVFDCWIESDPPTDSHPRFLLDDQVRAGTVGRPGSARLPITVGAYNPADGALGEFSARGPTTDGRVKPELCAPGVGITSAKSGARNTGRCCDCCTDFYMPGDGSSGTSTAAPHVTGVVALMFQADPTLDHVKIKQKLMATCRPPEPAVSPLPHPDWGAGKVNAEAAVKAAVPVVLAPAGPNAAAPARTAAIHLVEPILVPLAAYPASYLPAVERLTSLQRAIAADPVGQLAAALVSEHADEVLRLINTDRRVLLAWHRMNGPTLVRWLLADPDRDVLLPAIFGGAAVSDGLTALLVEFERAGSPRLRADAARHRGFVTSLPGVERQRPAERRVG